MCTLTSLGKFGKNAAQTSEAEACEFCRGGTFAKSTGMVACDGKPCDPGQESLWGTTSQKKCENCAVGTFAALPGSSECTYSLSLHTYSLSYSFSRSLRTFCMSSGLVCGKNAVAPIKSASCTECVDGRVPVASAACNFPGGALVCGIGYRADPTRCDRRTFLPPLIPHPALALDSLLSPLCHALHPKHRCQLHIVRNGEVRFHGFDLYDVYGLRSGPFRIDAWSIIMQQMRAGARNVSQLPSDELHEMQQWKILE